MKNLVLAATAEDEEEEEGPETAETETPGILCSLLLLEDSALRSLFLWPEALTDLSW